MNVRPVCVHVDADVDDRRRRKMYETEKKRRAPAVLRAANADERSGDVRCRATVCKSNSALCLDLTQRNLLSYSLGSSHFGACAVFGPRNALRATRRLDELPTCVKNIRKIVHLTTATESNSNDDVGIPNFPLRVPGRTFEFDSSHFSHIRDPIGNIGEPTNRPRAGARSDFPPLPRVSFGYAFSKGNGNERNLYKKRVPRCRKSAKVTEWLD